MKLITWIVLLIFARVPWQQKADSLINPPLMQQAESILRFDKSTLDIGTLTEDDAPQACRFTGRNISKEAVTVTKVRTTCGCTASGTACRRDTAGRNRYDCTDLSSEKSSRNDRYGCIRLSVLLGKASRGTPDPDRECSSRSG